MSFACHYTLASRTGIPHLLWKERSPRMANPKTLMTACLHPPGGPHLKPGVGACQEHLFISNVGQQFLVFFLIPSPNKIFHARILAKAWAEGKGCFTLHLQMGSWNYWTKLKFLSNWSYVKKIKKNVFLPLKWSQSTFPTYFLSYHSIVILSVKHNLYFTDTISDFNDTLTCEQR